MNIKELKEGVSIREFISRFVELGDSDKICCLFHEEDTPSFLIDDAGGFARCFGRCSKSFDIYEFYREYTGESHRSFVLYMAENYGKSVNLDSPVMSQLDIDIIEYKKSLLPEHIEYMLQRGVSKKIIRKYGVGYDAYGLFRGRLCIPIKVDGVSIGITARKFDEDICYSQAKYTLSSKLDGLHKSKIIGNWSSNRKSIIVFEGMFDVMSFDSLLRNDYKYHPVCIFGCKPSVEQLTLMSSLDKVVLCMDTSPSGVEGKMYAALSLIRSVYNYKNIYVMDITNPITKDFNDLVVRYKENWVDHVKEMSAVDYIVKTATKNLTDSHEVSKILINLDKIRNTFKNPKCLLEIVSKLECIKNSLKAKSIGSFIL
jgi:DNA primase